MDRPTQDAHTKAAKIRRAQWTAQFLAAAELVRRNYTVSFTFGNTTPVADLMVGTRPGGEQFWVDVKGSSSKGAPWLVRPKSDCKNLYYVLVYLAPLAEGKGTREPDRFFVLTQKEANRLEAEYRSAHPTAKTTMPGFAWKVAEKYEDKWDTLPKDFDQSLQ